MEILRSTELRIGNTIYYFGKEKNVTSEMIKEIELNNVIGMPIELTEEWLRKFRLKKKSNAVIWYEIPIFEDLGKIVVNAKTFTVEVSASGYRATTIKDCKVHQLQNLYFALTGKELEIK